MQISSETTIYKVCILNISFSPPPSHTQKYTSALVYSKKHSRAHKWHRILEKHRLSIPTTHNFVILSESINISVSMAIKALPNAVQIRGDKSIRSQQIRASDLQRWEHEGLGSRAEARRWKMDLPCQTPRAEEIKVKKEPGIQVSPIWITCLITALTSTKKNNKNSY